MRKVIMLAIAGYFWKKVKARYSGKGRAARRAGI